jgi:hypothetical protein
MINKILRTVPMPYPSVDSNQCALSNNLSDIRLERNM